MDLIERLQGDWDERVVAARCGDTVTCFAVVTRELLVAVDTMVSPASGRAFRALLEPLREGRPWLILNTHGDWDHYWGNQEFPGPILGTARCRERILAEGPAEREKRQQSDLVLTPPQVLVESDARIEGGDLSLQLVPVPGHQPDQVAVFIPELGLLLAADAAEEPFPLVDDPQGLPELRRSLQRMRDLDPTWVLACHAPPERGPGLLERNLAYFERLERDPRGYPEDPAWSPFYLEAHRKAVEVMCSTP